MITPQGNHQRFSVMLPVLAAVLFCAAEQPTVKVAPMDSVGPRPMEQQTQSSLVRDYLQAWQSMGSAFGQNRADLLDGYFVGTAKDQLSKTIREQQALGIQAAYRDLSHDLQVVFYSPEGLSVQLVDNVEFEMTVRDNEKTVGTKRIRTRYIAVLTPTESKWKIRVFQGGTESSGEARSGTD